MTLEIRDVTVSYGTASVLEGVSASGSAGELVGLLGPNGSGKTTLLKAAAGMLGTDSGWVEIDGVPVSDMTRREVAREIGYLPQATGGNDPATVFDTVLLGRNPHFGWRPGPADRTAVGTVLEDLGVDHLAMRELATLSGGQRRTVLLARALVQARSALLLDEPTSGLDLGNQVRVMTRIRESVRRADLVGMVAIHDLALASQFCDSFVLLEDGAVVTSGGTEVLSADTLERVYDIPVAVIQHGGRKHVVPRVDPAAVPETAGPDSAVVDLDSP